MAKISFKKVTKEIENLVIESITTNTNFANIDVTIDKVFKKKEALYSDILFYDCSEYINERKIVFNITAARKFKIIEDYLELYVSLLIPFNIHNAKIDSIINYTISLDDEFTRANKTVVEVDNYNNNILKKSVLSNIELAIKELDALSDIRVLDKLANEKLNDSAVNPRNIGSGIYYHKMIIAKLAGNKMYEEIYKYFIDVLEKDIAKQTKYSEESKVHIKITNQLYEDLKSVKPLENPGLI
ncbi:MAG: hypothetical protein P1P88_19635 [Bacteroidales bacterium]|nr:hypothetical protein [Bacteroidales bacterium]